MWDISPDTIMVIESRELRWVE